MDIVIAAIGRMKRGPELELLNHYATRLKGIGRGQGLTAVHITESLESRRKTSAERKAEEMAALSAAGKGLIIALDERGKSLTSPALAARIGQWRDDGAPALSFLIGGPDGLHPDLRRSADFTLSMSAMTFPHQIARLLLAEQLYRSFAILAGHPYHRD